MFKNLMRGVAIVLALALVAGCSDVVPPAMKGKHLSGSGYSTNVLEPGRHWRAPWTRIVMLDVSTQTVAEPLKVKMADNLDLTFVVRFRTRIAGTERTINAMFNDIRVENDRVTLQQVYGVYGKDVVQRVSRSVLGKYRTQDVAANFDKINQALHSQLVAAMEGSPLEVSNITLADLQYPEVITKAIEAQNERELAIKTAENEQAIEMVKRENSLKLAQADREIELTKARTLADQNEITNRGLSERLLQYKALEVQMEMTKNSSAVFVPYEALTSPGFQNRVYK
ncbi:hypothetical protein PAK_P30041 [Pseudomonas phage PAK_P3]|uniref:Band 7 domain-containing protein n=5 Tax=Nankokuvirus TaxID=1925779 RepID=A0A218L405_9CAUD|nr:lipoprotein [Pseudomonas phage PAK_P5]YP_008857676.1 lipoprotein [Pseudomonas phage PAK_P3]YP_008858065.1 lipoprotein [Pseudomonas phage CHA_P1]YP_009604719.1 lipoprotein [Pseudomonas phage vB_PaeM_G1]ADX32047.1 hypothetical protein P3_CHA0041 [Pseudomonas phage P3_CHA]QIQ65137.1 SPFH domain / band 7 family protein [Pseudomonas phage Epa18]WKW88913.1 lipoprotein [Pseudomonas phage LSL4]ADX32232.1 hypothetical protein PAK_P30041 [Pseudomonas phage PAK_P3]AGR88996.1 hypothetical protein CH